MFDKRAALRARRLGACGLALALLAGGGAAAAENAGVAVGAILPDAAMAGLNGPPRRLSSYRGRPLIINVWASWCGPCRAEAASLERFAWSDAGRGYAVIGISTDDDRGAAQRWLQRSNATLSHFIDSGLALEHLLGAAQIPLTVVVDPNGRVVAKVYGAREWDTADTLKIIERAVPPPTATGPRRRPPTPNPSEP